MSEKCFGRRKKGKCGVLTVNCPGYAACKFYKPIWRWKQDEAKHARQLQRLPKETQEYIAVKYYGGQMPWDDTEY